MKTPQLLWPFVVTLHHLATIAAKDATNASTARRTTASSTPAPAAASGREPSASPSLLDEPSAGGVESWPTKEQYVSTFPSSAPKPPAHSFPSNLPVATNAPDASKPAETLIDYQHPLKTLQQGNNAMNISPSEPLNEASQLIWEEVTAMKIDLEVRKADRQLEQVEVVVNLLNQEPPFVTVLTNSTTVTNTSMTLSTPSDFFRRHQLDHSHRRLQTTVSNLNIVFQVTVSIWSKQQHHDINLYITDAFDTTLNRQQYLKELKRRDAAFSSAELLNVITPIKASNSVLAVADEGIKSELKYGIAGGSLALLILIVCLVMFAVKRRKAHLTHDSMAQNDEERATEPVVVRRQVCSEIDFTETTDDGVSTLGDPISSYRQSSYQNSSQDSFSVDYEYQKTYQCGFRPSIAELEGDSNQSGLSVLKDDDTLEEQYGMDASFHVEAPPGTLGLVLEASGDGIPIIHAIKPSSPLANEVQVGDRLWSVDGVDVTVMLATEVAILIASKRENEARTFVFSRSPVKRRSQENALVAMEENNDLM